MSNMINTMNAPYGSGTIPLEWKIFYSDGEHVNIRVNHLTQHYTEVTQGSELKYNDKTYNQLNLSRETHPNSFNPTIPYRIQGHTQHPENRTAASTHSDRTGQSYTPKGRAKDWLETQSSTISSHHRSSPKKMSRYQKRVTQRRTPRS